MYDVLIVGTGPSGLSAAINLQLHNKDFLWFGPKAHSHKVEKSEKIANYPGMGLVTGAELNERFAAHAREMGLTIEDRLVTNIMAAGESYTLLAGNDMYEARGIILAIGAVTGKGIAGEAELLGRGVSYCATCDGFLYKGKTIAVLCMSKAYEHEVEYLAGLAEKVWLYTPYKDSGLHLPNVDRLASPLRAVSGAMRVEEIELADKSRIPVDGLFCLRDAVAPAVLLPGLAMDGAHISVDRDCATNLPGCFAAGDCTGRPYQIAKAVGEGNIAAHSLMEYLAQK